MQADELLEVAADREESLDALTDGPLTPREVVDRIDTSRSTFDRARGADPRQVTQRGNRTTFVFPADETGIETASRGPDGDIRVRLFAKREGTGRPVRGTATVEASEDEGNPKDGVPARGQHR